MSLTTLILEVLPFNFRPTICTSLNVETAKLLHTVRASIPIYTVSYLRRVESLVPQSILRLANYSETRLFDAHRALHRNIISIVKPGRRTNVSNLFYFGMTLYVFRTVFPSIIRSSRVYIQQQAFVKQIMLSTCKQADSSNCLTNACCCRYSL